MATGSGYGYPVRAQRLSATTLVSGLKNPAEVKTRVANIDEKYAT
ncbi:MAG: hypothetical protein P1U77_27415 [Rubripirellula sp.]|nr:hypothetical protein [Rubripirellula sp.]